jgi:hypothetical protein
LIGLARFPFVRDFDSFDFAAQPSIDKKQIREIATGRFIAGKLLAADFIEFGSSGAVYSRQQILDGLPKESPMELSATDFSARMLCDGVVLVTYRSMRRDPASGREWHSLRSSIWKLVDGCWLMAFRHAIFVASRRRRTRRVNALPPRRFGPARGTAAMGAERGRRPA